MAGWTFALLFQAMVTTSPSMDYAEAYQKSVETGKPLVIVIGADWCPSCQQLKKQTLPSLRKEGALNGTVFTSVDREAQQPLATKLMRGDKLPQMIIFHRDQEGWHKQHMVGILTENAVRSAINTAKQASTSEVLLPPLEQL